jgi:FdhD protein
MSRQFVTRADHDVGPTQRARVRTLRGDRLEPRDDLVAIEEPLEIRIARSGDTGPGTPVSVTMRTPGHDAELAMGFLHGEGLIRSRGDVACVREGGPDGNVVYVELSAAHAPDTSRLQRNFYATSSCGVCGKASLAALAGMFDLPAVDDGLRVDSSLLTSLGDVARAAQPGFRDTGGLHAASLFEADGRLVASFEDVGRHNALDKLIGSMLLDDALPLVRFVLHLSGRASFELVQKAAVAGIPVVAAVGAPSSLAIELAERTGMLLAGFLRDDSFNVYSHAERLR